MMNRLRGIDFDAMSDSQLEATLDERREEQVRHYTIHVWINLAAARHCAPDFCSSNLLRAEEEIAPDDPRGRRRHRTAQ